MSQQNVNQKITMIAGADLSNNIYNLVKLGTTEDTIVLAGSDDRVIGVLDNKPKSDEQASVIISGTAKVKAGGTIAYGDYVVSNASGQAIKRTTESNVVGIALEAGASGDIIEILLMPLVLA